MSPPMTILSSYMGAIAAARPRSVSGGGGGGSPTSVGAHRYWRIVVDEIGEGRPRAFADEIEFWSHPYAVRHLGGTHDGSSYVYVANTPSYASDDKLLGVNPPGQYFWFSASTPTPHWYSYDAGEGNEFECAAISISAGVAYGSESLRINYAMGWIAGYTVQYSDDGSNWFDAWSVENVTYDPVGYANTSINPTWGGDPTPTLDESDLLHWLKVDGGAYSDAASPSTPCADGDGVYWMPNYGSNGTAFTQTTSANRPVYKTGGQNGYPYLLFDAPSAQRFFADIAHTQPSGITSITPFGLFFVGEVNIGGSPPNFPALFGNASGNLEKNVAYFRSEPGAMMALGGNSSKRGNDFSPNEIMIALFRHSHTTLANFTVWQNNVQTLTYNDSAANLDTTAHTACQLFRHTGIGGADGYFSGKCYELILLHGNRLYWNRVRRVLWYLTAKYGIYGGSPL